MPAHTRLAIAASVCGALAGCSAAPVSGVITPGGQAVSGSTHQRFTGGRGIVLDTADGRHFQGTVAVLERWAGIKPLTYATPTGAPPPSAALSDPWTGMSLFDAANRVVEGRCVYARDALDQPVTADCTLTTGERMALTWRQGRN